MVPRVSRAIGSRAVGTRASGRQRILVVSPYPPVRDGIGAYALQQVRSLRAAGNDVEACSPWPSAAHHHIDLVGPRGALALGRLMRTFDRVIIHLHPDVFYRHPATPTSRIAEGLALGAAIRAGPGVEIRLHEIDQRWADRTDPSARVTAWMLAGADRITVHSGEQRDHLVDRFSIPAARVQIVEHGSDFTRRAHLGRPEARASLGLPANDHVFLCIGFLQPHKGFDRAARAFPPPAGLAGRGARLDIVGSVRLDDQATSDHVDELRRLAREVPGVYLHVGFVSDEAFDRWIVAADTVVLPYRHIWSSSVAERAALYDRPIIATRVGGLDEQLRAVPGAVLVEDNLALAAAMSDAMGSEAVGADQGSAVAAKQAWPVEGGVDRSAVQSEIRSRAAVSRGGPTMVRTRPSRTGAGDADQVTAPSAPLRRIRPLHRPAPVSARPGVTTVKRLIHRLIAWELDPIADQVNRLQRATTQAIDAQTELILDDDR